jgi:hypothetical protein
MLILPWGVVIYILRRAGSLSVNIHSSSAGVGTEVPWTHSSGTYSNYLGKSLLSAAYTQYYTLKAGSIRRRNYWGSSLWIESLSISYWSDVLHSSQRERREYSRGTFAIYIDLKRIHDSVRRVLLYDTLTECCTPVKLVRLHRIQQQTTVGNNKAGTAPPDSRINTTEMKEELEGNWG